METGDDTLYEPEIQQPDVMIYRGLQLDRFQAEAINHVREGRSVLVSAPTGTGKTAIADYVVDQAIAEGREVVYTAPIKALSNQKYRDYTRLHGKERIGLVTGDLVINQDAQIRIMTTEILRNILLQGTRPPNLSHVIIDEVHFLDDEERGTVWEELLIYLPREVKIVALSATLPNVDEFADWLEHVRGEPVMVVKENRRAVPLRLLLANKDVGILDFKEYERKYRAHVERMKREQAEGGGGDRDRGGRYDRGDRHHGGDRFHGDRQHSGDRFHGGGDRFHGGGGRAFDDRGRAGRDDRSGQGPRGDRPGGFGRFGGGGGDSRRGDRGGPPKTRHVDIIDMVRGNYLPILYFIFSRRQTETFARELARKTRYSFLDRKEVAQVQHHLDDFEAANKEVLTPEHRDMYLRGIAFHHAGLHVGLKALVEEMYEQRLVRVLYCTSTFALGINMPARTVVFDSLRKFNGSSVQPLTVRQFLQKAGRAGRRGMDRIGYVVIREDFNDYTQDKPLLQMYQHGDHEPINSAFNLSFSSIVNLLARHSETEIQQILDKSFLNFCHRKELERERANLESLMSKIEEVRGEGGGRRDTIKKWKKRAARLERELDGRESIIWEKFKEKEDFLKLAGYLDDDGQFNAGARALLHIQINEIFVTELLLEGILEEADEDELFGILTGLVHEFPRSVVPREPLRGRWSKFRERIRRVKESEVVSRGAEFYPTPISFCPELMPFGHLWAQGHSLNALMLLLQSDVDVSGDLVGAFRRAKDLAGQIRVAYKDNEMMVERLSNIIRKVSRDEVEVID